MKFWSLAVALTSCILLSATPQTANAGEVFNDTLFFTADSHLFTTTTTNVSFSLGNSYPLKDRFSYEVTLHLTKSASPAATSNAPCGKHCLTKRYTIISNATANLLLSVGSLLKEMESKFNRDEAREEEEEEEEIAIVKPSSFRYIHLFVKVYQMEADGEARGKQVAANVRTIAITDDLLHYFDVVKRQWAKPEHWSNDDQFMRFETIHFTVEPKGWLQSRLEDSKMASADGDEHTNSSISTAKLTYSWALTGPMKMSLIKPDVMTSSKPVFSVCLRRSGKYLVTVGVVFTEDVTEKSDRLEGGGGDGGVSKSTTTTTKHGYYKKMIEVKKRKYFF